mmetsp:Transcript_23918/g.54415  ORF Transcript_23918/g.54415 Transcript_23918/m.54415 type:complete len:160 (-) Transcript_23918:75-554(-)
MSMRSLACLALLASGAVAVRMDEHAADLSASSEAGNATAAGWCGVTKSCKSECECCTSSSACASSTWSGEGCSWYDPGTGGTCGYGKEWGPRMRRRDQEQQERRERAEAADRARRQAYAEACRSAVRRFEAKFGHKVRTGGDSTELKRLANGKNCAGYA